MARKKVGRSYGVPWTRECRRVRVKGGKMRTVCRSKKTGKITRKARSGTKRRKQITCKRYKTKRGSRMVCRRPDGRFARKSR